MLTDKRFRFKATTLAIDSSDERRIDVTVPAGAIIEIAPSPRPENTWMIDIRWNRRTLLMFVEDVHNRGERSLIESKGVKALRTGLRCYPYP